MWLKECVFYEIYVPSFADSNGDGIGDLLGIINQLDYLHELGITGIWLTPFYQSPKVDNGYDISNYYEIDPCYGNMDQFVMLLNKAKKLGIKVIIDLVLNHTSNQHPWFLEAQKNLENDYRDYYIWKKEIPNNWQSFFGGSAWEYSTMTDTYYYHAFSKEQVCLNWSNSMVKTNMKKTIKFWLDIGVDGFRLDVINFLKTDKESFMVDNPYDEKGIQMHRNDQNQQGVIEVIQELKAYTKTFGEKILIGEVGSEDLDILNRYVGEDKLDVVFNFNLGSIKKFNTKEVFRQLLEMNKTTNLPTLFFGSHDMSRWFSRLAKDDIRASKVIAALMLFGYGVPFIYQGDERPLKDTLATSIGDIKDIRAVIEYQRVLETGETDSLALEKANTKSRDKSRQLLDWKSDTKSEMYNYYQKLLLLRKEYKQLHFGEYNQISKCGEAIILTRIFKGEEIIIILNFGDETIEYNNPGSELIYSNMDTSNNYILPFEVSLYTK